MIAHCSLSRFLRFLLRALVFTIIPLVVAEAGSSEVESGKLLAAIASRGPSKVVEELYAPGGLWPSVVAKISEGHDNWLTVAVALHPGTDGGASEELDEAIFLALGTAPIAVLKLLKQREFDADFVCSSNIAVDYSVDQSRRFIDERLRALDRVTVPSLADIKMRCERGLQNGLKDLDRIGADQ
jgi:hypothetical protein